MKNEHRTKYGVITEVEIQQCDVGKEKISISQERDLKEKSVKTSVFCE